jgi:hypothetical protein
MEELSKPKSPIDRVMKILEDLFEKFKKTPYTIPVAVGVTAVLYYLMMAYIPGTCWIGLVPSLLLFGLLWQFDVRRVRKLLLTGLATAVVIMTISTVFLVNSFQTMEMDMAASPGSDPVMFNGTVTPTTGGESTVFTYSITIRSPGPDINVTDVRVNITSLMTTRNETMTANWTDSVLNETHYIFVTNLPDPINQFHFVAKVNDTWVRATDYLDDGTQIPIVGPIHSDPFAVAWPVIKYVSLYQAFLQFFPIFAILCGMVWWMRRARRMREDAVKRYEEKRKEVEAKVPEDKRKIASSSTSSTPSLERAMGLEAEPETFVCSDCGADVPADARKCPFCGEKFE